VPLRQGLRQRRQVRLRLRAASLGTRRLASRKPLARPLYAALVRAAPRGNWHSRPRTGNANCFGGAASHSRRATRGGSAARRSDHPAPKGACALLRRDFATRSCERSRTLHRDEPAGAGRDRGHRGTPSHPHAPLPEAQSDPTWRHPDCADRARALSLPRQCEADRSAVSNLGPISTQEAPASRPDRLPPAAQLPLPVRRDGNSDEIEL
jgi:hypothetical protein